MGDVSTLESGYHFVYYGGINLGMRLVLPKKVPVYFDFFFGQLGNRFRPKVYAGVAPGFLLDAKNNDIEVDNDNFNNVNFALTGGLGFNWRLASRVWLNTDLRAFLGLNDIREEGLRSGDKVANNTVQLSLGVAYGLSKL